MSYTTNLELKIIDDSDNFDEVFPQGNYNANKLEEKIGGYLDDMEDLPEMRTDIATLQNSVSALLNRTIANETAIGNVSSRVSQIEQGKGFYINENGEQVDGIITRFIVNTTATGYNSVINFDDNKLVIRNGDVSINLYEMLGITSMSGKFIVNANCYVNAYNGFNPNFAFSGVYKFPTQNYFRLNFHACDSVYANINQSIPDYQDKAVTVVFDLFDESNIPE